MSDFVELETNVPQTVALGYDDGRLVETRYGQKMFFTLVDGRVLSLKPEAAAQIAKLEVRRQQPFCICKREVKGAGGKKHQVIDVWLPETGEALRAVPDTLEQQLRASLAQIDQRKQAGASVASPAPVATAPSSVQSPQPLNNGNGIKNGAARPYQASGIPAPPTKIPYNIAFRELLQVVIDGLKAAGEQWSDGAKQDAVSTLLIQASRDGLLTCWERAPRQAVVSPEPAIDTGGYPMGTAEAAQYVAQRKIEELTTSGEIIRAFAGIQEQLSESKYLAHLARYGVKSPAGFRSTADARKCYREMSAEIRGVAS